MIVIPAIDLKDGQCVRLRQGKMEDVSVFGSDPVAVAQRWVDAGARRLHMVDLNGAFAGKPGLSWAARHKISDPAKILANRVETWHQPKRQRGGEQNPVAHRKRHGSDERVRAADTNIDVGLAEIDGQQLCMSVCNV